MSILQGFAVAGVFLVVGVIFCAVAYVIALAITGDQGAID